MRRALLGALLLVSLTSCTTLPPLARAMALAGLGDGCSWAPDIGGDACSRHDLAYAIGGSDEDRAIADHELALGLYSWGYSVRVVESYFAAVRRYGGKSWRQGEPTRKLPQGYPFREGGER